MATKHISMIQVLKAQKQYLKNPNKKWGYEILQDETGQCAKVCYRAMEKAASLNLIDYGVSIGTAWITKKGMKLLAESDNNNPTP